MLLCKGDPWETDRAAYGGGTSMPQLGHIRIVAYSQFVSHIISSHNLCRFQYGYSIEPRVCVDLHRFIVNLAFLVLCSWYGRDLTVSPLFCSLPISSQLELIII